MFKAARYYYDYIMKYGLSRWSKLPQARYLFNSPYHGAAPITSDDSVKRILHHIAICGNRRCTCNLDDYFCNRQLHLQDCRRLPDEIDKQILTTKESRVVSAKVSTEESESNYADTVARKTIKRIPKVMDNTFLDNRNDVQNFTTDNLKESPANAVIKTVKRIPLKNTRSFIRPAHPTTQSSHSKITSFSVNVQTSTERILCFPEEASTWKELDDQCEYDDDFYHHNGESVRHRSSLLTTELQDLRAHRLGTTTIAAYLKILCMHTCGINVQYFDPIYTSIMIGLDLQSRVDVHTIFKDSHLMCDKLLCAIVHDGHISIIIVDYAMITLFHDDSCCGLHDSGVFLDGMEKFLRSHLKWRQDHSLPTREGFSEVTQWRKVQATTTTSAQQEDIDSCGIFTCWHATSRVLNIDPLLFTHRHVPLMRLQIYHCFKANRFFVPTIGTCSDITMQRMHDTGVWYALHRNRYRSLQEKRRMRITTSTWQPSLNVSDQETTPVTDRVATHISAISTIPQTEKVATSLNQNTVFNDSSRTRSTKSHRHKRRRRHVTTMESASKTRHIDIISEAPVLPSSLPSGKRTRDIRDFLNKHQESTTENTLIRRKRTHARGGIPSITRQRTRMDAYVTRSRPTKRLETSETGRSDGVECISQTVGCHEVSVGIDVLSGGNSIRRIGVDCHVTDEIDDIVCRTNSPVNSPVKRLRTDKSAENTLVSSTMEYDKRIADS